MEITKVPQAKKCQALASQPSSPLGTCWSWPGRPLTAEHQKLRTREAGIIIYHRASTCQWAGQLHWVSRSTGAVVWDIAGMVVVSGVQGMGHPGAFARPVLGLRRGGVPAYRAQAWHQRVLGDLWVWVCCFINLCLQLGTCSVQNKFKMDSEIKKPSLEFCSSPLPFLLSFWTNLLV